MKASKRENTTSNGRGNGAQRRAPRVQKLKGRPLREAVRAECIKHVKERSGLEWDPAHEAFLFASIHPTEEAIAVSVRETANLLRDARTAALAFARQYPEGGGVHADTIRSFATLLSQAAAEHNLGWAWQHEIDAPPTFDPRALLVIEHGVPDAWWWKRKERDQGKGTATGKDLAVLSLLAGNWPDVDREPRRPAEVIHAEQRALQHVRKKFSLKSWLPEETEVGRRLRESRGRTPSDVQSAAAQPVTGETVQLTNDCPSGSPPANAHTRPRLRSL
jgi:hypothetical protein